MFSGVEKEEEEGGGRGNGLVVYSTFLRKLFHFSPPTRTLTVLSISPAVTTMP